MVFNKLRPSAIVILIIYIIISIIGLFYIHKVANKNSSINGLWWLMFSVTILAFILTILRFIGFEFLKDAPVIGFALAQLFFAMITLTMSQYARDVNMTQTEVNGITPYPRTGAFIVNIIAFLVAMPLQYYS